MNKDIKDYLHLYLGCEVRPPHGGTIKYRLVGIDYDNEPLFKTIPSGGFAMELSKFKFLLRPVTDRTAEEKQWLDEHNDFKEKFLQGDTEYELLIEWEAERIQYLLSKHFDLFGLIEAGLAIDKTKQP